MPPGNLSLLDTEDPYELVGDVMDGTRVCSVPAHSVYVVIVVGSLLKLRG